MNTETQAEEIFLATTALEEFWDASKPIVFLGEWCLLYERRSSWQALDGRLLASPYDNADAADNAYCYINRIYEQMLPLLAVALNSIHSQSHSPRYWRILIGPWLQLYLPVVYDRFLHIRHALDQYPGFTTIGLSAESFVVPTDTLSFACFLSEDSYNLQLYTKILSVIGREFPCKKMEAPRNPLYGKLLGNSLKRRAVSYAVKIFAGVSTKFSKTTLFRNSYFPKQVELQLTARNIGRILPSWNQVVPCRKFKYDSEKRDALRYLEIGKDEFELCLAAMLFADMPQCFVEGFGSVEDGARENYPRKTEAIFSANGWYYDEAFKQWSAKCADDGTMLLGTQHGGNYGALKNMPSEDHELAIVDRYYSWGWARTDCKAKVIAMPATKLIGRKKLAADNSMRGILWVATSAHRYVIQYPFLPAYFQEYLAWQARFANALPQLVMKEVRFRPHYENYGWGTAEQLKDAVPGVQVESWDVPFQESLGSCRLYVCDHLSTTFAEALAANKPTVLFWNPDANKLRAEAQSYFDLLRDAGIFFDTPEAAAVAVADVYDDVEAWWNNAERQETIRLFCERFARTSPDAITLWSNELKRVSELPSLKQ